MDLLEAELRQLTEQTRLVRAAHAYRLLDQQAIRWLWQAGRKLHEIANSRTRDSPISNLHSMYACTFARVQACESACFRARALVCERAFMTVRAHARACEYEHARVRVRVRVRVRFSGSLYSLRIQSVSLGAQLRQAPRKRHCGLYSRAIWPAVSPTSWHRHHPDAMIARALCMRCAVRISVPERDAVSRRPGSVRRRSRARLPKS